MPRKTPEQKIAELKKKQEAEKTKAKKKLAQLKAQIANENAKLAAAERKKDTRRKVIAGALALKHMEFDPAFADTMHKLFNEQIERAEDKKLFADYFADNQAKNKIL